MGRRQRVYRRPRIWIRGQLHWSNLSFEVETPAPHGPDFSTCGLRPQRQRIGDVSPFVLVLLLVLDERVGNVSEEEEEIGEHSSVQKSRTVREIDRIRLYDFSATTTGKTEEPDANEAPSL